MDLGLKGKSIIIMAGSKGLGKGTARVFADEGAHVVIGSRNEAELTAAVKEIRDVTGNRQVSFRVCDITNPDDIKGLVKYAA